jgi:phosphoribosylanthranilate isomerase
MSLKIKVCGLREPSNIEEVASLNPDYMGFIFYKKSPRYVGDDFVVPSIDSRISRVGVFVNHDHDFIIRQAEKSSLSHVQLHGDELPDACRRLKSAGLSVIKVFRIDAGFGFDSTKPFESCCDYFLFDTKGENYGGTGKAFDWSVLDQYKYSTPFFLSGGLNADNLSQVNSIPNSVMIAIDLNSGVEERPGKKDMDKLKNIFSQLNRA